MENKWLGIEIEDLWWLKFSVNILCVSHVVFLSASKTWQFWIAAVIYSDHSLYVWDVRSHSKVSFCSPISFILFPIVGLMLLFKLDLWCWKAKYQSLVIIIRNLIAYLCSGDLSPLKKPTKSTLITSALYVVSCRLKENAHSFFTIHAYGM